MTRDKAWNSAIEIPLAEALPTQAAHETFSAPMYFNVSRFPLELPLLNLDGLFTLNRFPVSRRLGNARGMRMHTLTFGTMHDEARVVREP